MRSVPLFSKILRFSSILPTLAMSFLAITVLVSPARAIPILESDNNLAGLAAAAAVGLSDDCNGNNCVSNFGQYTANGGLIFDKNISGAEIDQIALTNKTLLGSNVDALAKWNINNTSPSTFESYHPDVTDSDAFSITNCSAKCASFDWAFDASKTTLGDDWEIVKIGVKYGNLLAYFLIDGDNDGIAEADDGSISGSFNIFDYVPAEGDYLFADLPDPNLLDGVFQINDLKDGGQDVGKKYVLNGLSHADFFGVDGTTTSVPEPGTLALFGIGLIGLGAMTRRRRKAA